MVTLRMAKVLPAGGGSRKDKRSDGGTIRSFDKQRLYGTMAARPTFRAGPVSIGGRTASGTSIFRRCQRANGERVNAFGQLGRQHFVDPALPFDTAEAGKRFGHDHQGEM